MRPAGSASTNVPSPPGFAFRYALAGGVNTLLGLTLFPLLQTLLGPAGVHYLITLCLAQLVCVSTSYFLLRKFVFAATKNSFVQYLMHGTFYWLYLIFNLALLPLIVQRSHADPRIVQFFISATAIALAFLWQTRVVFKKIPETH